MNKEDLIAKLLEDKKITFKEALILMEKESNQNINYNPFKDYPNPNSTGNPGFPNYRVIC